MSKRARLGSNGDAAGFNAPAPDLKHLERAFESDEELPLHKSTTRLRRAEAVFGLVLRVPLRRLVLQIALAFGALVFLLHLFRRSHTKSHAWVARWHGKRAEIWLPGTPNAPYSEPVFREHPVIRPLRPGYTDRTSFRANLLQGERYLVAQSYLGFNNQFQSIMHLLYLALKMERVAVLPPLQPIHINPPSFAPVSEFFDLEAMQKATGVAVIEWQDLKESVLDNANSQREEIACWSTREASTRRPGRYQGSEDVTWTWLGLKPVLWPLPSHIRGTPSGYTPFSQLIAWDSDGNYKADWARQVEELANNVTERGIPPKGSIRPDENVLCFDDTFYLAESTHALSPSYPHEKIGPQLYYGSLGIADAHMPGWRTIGQHLHWQPAVRDEADRFLRFTFGLSKNARIPDYIAVHIRHGDFGNKRQVDLYSERVSWVREQLDTAEASPYKGRANTLPVICSTDDTSPEFLAQVLKEGWFLIDHDAFGTIRRHGLVGDEIHAGWWPTILSSAILGGSQGFVGSHYSTFSIYSWIRVLTWQEGGIGTEETV